MPTGSHSPGTPDRSISQARARQGSRVAAAALLAAGLILAWGLHAGGRNAALLQAELGSSEQAGSILSAMKDLETGERGFLLTGNDAFLQPYHVAEAELTRLLEGGGNQPGFVDLRQLVQAKRDAAAQAISVRRSQGPDAAAALLTLGEAKATMDTTRARVAEIKATAVERVGQLRQQDRARSLLTAGSSFLAAAAACGWFAILAVSRRREERFASALLEGVMDNAPIGLGFMDHELTLRHVNRTLAALDGAAARTGQGAWEIPSGLRSRIEGELNDVVQYGRATSNLEVDIAPDRQAEAGRSYLVSLYPLPLREAGRQIDGAGMVLVDITDRKRAEAAAEAARAAAEEASRAKSSFIANMSHELRTPLSAIIGYSEMLLEEVEEAGDPDNHGRDLHKIEGNARHLLGLINDVLDLSKVESGKMDVFAETFDLGSTIADVASTVVGLVERRGNRLCLHLSPDLGQAHTDVTKLRQILLNLLSNAAKFTENGTITLSAALVANRAGTLVTIQVSDTGIGMTREQLAKLFQRFQQADASTTRRFGGTGLGLSLAKVFSTMLGGDITVRSTPGEGTTFTTTLPVTLPAEEPGAAADL